jgi:hypothetical protein
MFEFENIRQVAQLARTICCPHSSIFMARFPPARFRVKASTPCIDTFLRSCSDSTWVVYVHSSNINIQIPDNKFYTLFVCLFVGLFVDCINTRLLMVVDLRLIA